MVVEHQPIDHLVHGLASCRKAPAVQPADLQSAPQALSGRVVPAVALAAHRGLHLVARKRTLKLMAAVLATPVRMEDQPRLRAPSEPCHAQRISDQAGLHVRLHAPAHHLTAKQVNDRCQIQPAFVGGDVGDVAGPRLVGRLGG
jgi:hypothetical protein